LNVGANVRLLDDRLSYVVDYFHDKRYDMYMANNNVTSLLGLIATVDQNIGEMYSQGVEMALSWQSTFGKVGYRFGGMYSITDNMIEKTGEVVEPHEWMQSAGYGRGIRRGYVDQGLFQSYDDIATSPLHTFSEVAPGDIKYKDIN